MDQYRSLVSEILEDGTRKGDRTGTGTLSVFGRQMHFDLSQGFPLLTLKYTNFDAVVAELLWFLSGSTNIKNLDSKIWNQWADEDGRLGPIYGAQWRDWGGNEWGAGCGRDQILELIDGIQRNPDSRRHIVSAWNVDDLPCETVPPQQNVKWNKMALAPCHVLFQFYVADGHLSCQLYQRSADVFLGLPFNIASYALLTHMIAQVCDLKPGHLVHTLGDAHLYLNHVNQTKTMLQRFSLRLPDLKLNPLRRNIDDFKFQDIKTLGYNSHPAIKAPIAV